MRSRFEEIKPKMTERISKNWFNQLILKINRSVMLIFFDSHFAYA